MPNSTSIIIAKNFIYQILKDLLLNGVVYYFLICKIIKNLILYMLPCVLLFTGYRWNFGSSWLKYYNITSIKQSAIVQRTTDSLLLFIGCLLFFFEVLIKITLTYPCIVFPPDFLGPWFRSGLRPCPLLPREETEEFRSFGQQTRQCGPKQFCYNLILIYCWWIFIWLHFKVHAL